MIATLPDAWLAVLPAPGSASAEPIAVAYESVEINDLRQRIADLAHGKKGDEWGALRRAVRGERMFRIEGGPGDPALPLVVGVDEFLSKRVLWRLAAEIPTVPPADIALVLEPSLSLLRSDVESLGATSRWTSDHVESKWIRASEKVEGDRAESRDFVDRLTASIAEGAAKRESALPLVIQFDDRFYALDDRTPVSRYEGPMRPSTLRAMLRELWGERRVLDIATEKQTRAMTPAEIVDAYGRAVSSVATEYASPSPRVDDLTLVLPHAVRDERIEPREDPHVAEWLDVLDPTGALLDWIAYARAERCNATVPALALIGGAHVGKSLLADGIARAYGMRRATPLGRVLGRFASMLQAGPVLFSDEGLPRDPRTQVPLTEEFRALVTSMDHVIELKGIDRPVYVRGGVRAILAANRMDRLFSNRGTYGAHDIDALVRRLFVVEIDDEARVEKAKRLALSLGSVDGDPVRLARVAGHLAHVQATRTSPAYPAPRARNVERALRLGGDLAKRALDVLDDASPADWICFDEATIWIQVRPWISALHEDSIASVARALAAYITHPSERRRTHPTTQATDPARSRWIGLDRQRLATDGVLLGT